MHVLSLSSPFQMFLCFVLGKYLVICPLASKPGGGEQEKQGYLECVSIDCGSQAMKMLCKRFNGWRWITYSDINLI